MKGKITEKWINIPLTVKASVSYVVCNILQTCLSFITLPLFTRLLTIEQYGQYTIYSSWSGILSIFITLNLAYGSFSTAMIKYEDRRDEYISSIQGVFVFLACVFLLVYIPFQNIFNEIFDLPTSIVIIMVLDILFLNVMQLWRGKKRFEFRYKSVIAVTLITSLLSPIIAYIFVLSSSEKGYARILGYALTNIIVGFAIFVLNLIRGKRLYNKELWKYAFGFNLPLLAYYLSQVIFNQSDRIMISNMTSVGDAALYGVAYNLAMVLIFILNAINNSYVPWFYQKIKENKTEQTKHVSTSIAILMALLILVIIWYAPEIIILMAGKQYSPAVYVVAPVAMSLLLLFYSQLFINVEFYFEEKKKLVWASIGAAVLNIVLNYFFIPVFGFVVAAYTTLISYVVFALFNYFAMRSILVNKNIPNNIYNYKGLMLLLLLFAIVGFTGVILYRWILIRVFITIFLLIILIINKQRFVTAFKMIKE